MDGKNITLRAVCPPSKNRLLRVLSSRVDASLLMQCINALYPDPPSHILNPIWQPMQRSLLFVPADGEVMEILSLATQSCDRVYKQDSAVTAYLCCLYLFAGAVTLPDADPDGHDDRLRLITEMSIRIDPTTAHQCCRFVSWLALVDPVFHDRQVHIECAGKLLRYLAEHLRSPS